MPVTIVKNEDKVDMYVDHYDGGFTLTEIAEDNGVSRKTVRRCIDEVNNFFDSLNVGDSVPYLDEETDTVHSIEITSKDEQITDPIPVRANLPDGENEWVALYRLMDSQGLEPEDDSEEEIDENAREVIFVGDRVVINESSKFYRENDKGNPVGVVGTVVEVREHHWSSLPYLVEWDNEITNSYGFEDIDIATESDEVTENAQYFVTAPQDSITIVRIDQDTGEVTQRQTNKHRANFLELRNQIALSQSQETLREVYLELDTTRMLESYSVGRVKVNPQTESVVFVKPNGSERDVPDDIATDIITTVTQYGKEQGDRLVRFLDKLMDNPSFRSIEGLYRFMKHNCIEINEDGSIQAWKGVREDLYSISSGKIQSSETVTVVDGHIYNGDFGHEVRVDRSEVDDDAERTCSYGLHVGNREYANGFGRTLLRVKVEPQDVVAVPKDYNGAKMRCCAYTPLEAI